MVHTSDPHPDDSALQVGYVAGSHGVRGGVRIVVHDPESEAIAPGRTVILCREDKPTMRRTVESVAMVPGKTNLRRVMVEGITDRDKASELRGYTVMIDRDQLPELADDEYYLVDAIGLPVVRMLDGERQSLGKIYGITHNGAQDLYEVRWRDPSGRNQDWLLPILRHTIVNMADDHVLVELPIGLLPEGLEPESTP